MLGLDAVADIRDITYDIQNWEWTWSHAGKTLIDVVGLIPVIGAIKYADEVVEVVKQGEKIKGVLKELLGKVKGIVNKIVEEAAEILKNETGVVRLGFKGIGNFENANFASYKLLRSHYNKHVLKQKEFGNIKMDEYLKGARKLINSKLDGNILTKTRSNGDILFYNKSTNEFAVVTKDGVIRTYFKPKEGIEYFKKQ
ncbi:hypothetical protein [Vulcanibacillus modesticaldus]|nr:hypothetical protein [Vulcanibacillus modesticaldus]